MENVKANDKKYYVGLDIGTDSVGYAVTDESYKLKKYHGEPMIGTHLMDAASNSEDRRAFRTARRRLDRRQQRVQLIRELFAVEIGKVDQDFYKRLDSSALCAEDKFTVSKNSFFNDEFYQDRQYHAQYPTIHHLIMDLINNLNSHDVRLIYLAVSYLIAHRGHFLNEVDKEDIDNVLCFENIYNDFCNYFEVLPWECDVVDLQNLLKKKIGITAKKKELEALLFSGKKPKCTEEDLYNKGTLVNLLAGGKVKCSELFCNDAYSEISSVSLSMKDEEFDAILTELGDDGELLMLSKKLYDWSILTDLVPPSGLISERKVEIYNQHKEDLKFLKYFIKKYCKEKYDDVFRSSTIATNYVAYSYNVKNSDKLSVKSKANKVTFCEYISKIVKGISIEECDLDKYQDMMRRLDKDVLSFMPKQVDGDNRVIPYQLYYVELKKILNNCKNYLPFLMQKDEDGISTYDKILSVFEFRVPYFVGPLNAKTEKFSWIQRKPDKIYPWNFEKVVMIDESEAAFIKRMTNTCTYYPGKKVLPKNSLLYTKYVVLNEINNLRVNGEKITVKCKQDIYNDLFMKKVRVTVKDIRDYLTSNGIIGKNDLLSGVDETIKSSLRPYHFFKYYIENNILSTTDVERILEMKAYSEDNIRFRKWLAIEYPILSEKDCKDIVNQKFKEFGRLSKAFLAEVEGMDKSTGELFNSIIDALWNTNYNLMQLLSDEFTFRDSLNEIANEYYASKNQTLTERLNEMYVSNAVKRQIIRTLDVVNDIVKVEKTAPTKIFIEMARGATEDQKNKRTKSRRDQIKEFYKSFPESEVRMLKEQLESKDDRELRGEALYLYFIQLGKCMYSGEMINIEKIGSEAYNVDHIYPQSFVKDDSLSNKVLVKSELNGEKSNEYPIRADIRNKMGGFWYALKEKELISEEKYKRLTRHTPFSEKEKWEFINRQLVETRQSTKVVATLLKELYPDTEIVYVKAGLVSEFRQKNGMLKSRSINDLHHAKDAYLNIVVGNVYSSVFNKRWFNINSDYSIRTDTLFKFKHKVGEKVIWEGKPSIDAVRKVVSKNNIHLTKYSFCKHGGFFDQMPVKADGKTERVARKKGLDPLKYGGYNKPSASFFCLVKFKSGKKQDLIFMPVELMYADRFLKDIKFAEQYAKETLGKMLNAEVQYAEFPLNRRIIKINTVLELDGFRVFISGKANGGDILLLSSLTSLKLDGIWEEYIKRLDSFDEKRKKKGDICVSEKYDKITAERNIELYNIYREKIKNAPFNKMPGASVAPILENGTERFASLSVEDQVTALLNIGTVLKTGRKGGCNLELIGGSKAAGALGVSSCVSNWKKRYSNVRIIDSSASGLFEGKSVNLFELL